MLVKNIDVCGWGIGQGFTDPFSAHLPPKCREDLPDDIGLR